MDEAKEVAEREGIRMVVTFDPYAENQDETQNFNYFPSAATGIFKYEKIEATIEPGA